MSDEIKQDTGAESATVPEIKNDIAERVENFNKDLKALLGKYELALTGEPRIHEGRIVADPRVLDARVLPPKK